MPTPKTIANNENVDSFLSGLDKPRRQEAQTVIALMGQISDKPPTMWGSSIVGFGSRHYRYESGHEGDMPILSFSPRKANLTIYFEGFDAYGDSLAKLGKHKISSACLYITKLSDINLDVLRNMLAASYEAATHSQPKPTTAEQYISTVPKPTRPHLDELRQIVKQTLPDAEEVLSYGIIGYKIDAKRARVYISGWKDHVALYPVPKDAALQKQLAPYIKGKGTLWFSPDEPLPKSLIESTVNALASEQN